MESTIEQLEKLRGLIVYEFETEYEEYEKVKMWHENEKNETQKAVWFDFVRFHYDKSIYLATFLQNAFGVEFVNEIKEKCKINAKLDCNNN